MFLRPSLAFFSLSYNLIVSEHSQSNRILNHGAVQRVFNERGRCLQPEEQKSNFVPQIMREPGRKDGGICARNIL